MFTIGEFALLARVSKRLLRYYDEIGLFKPIHIDSSSGYRYYTAEQMVQLNRILVLKELDLSLDQIRRMLNDTLSTDEMQGMLLLKKAEIEQALRAELQRIQKIEARLSAIRTTETNTPLDVVIKEIPAQFALSTTAIFESFDEAVRVQQGIRSALPERNGYGLCFIICHDDEVLERDMTLEMGCMVETSTHAPVVITDALRLVPRQLSSVPMMATMVITGGLERIHAAYGEMGLWVQNNGYRMTDKPREITLKGTQSPSGYDLVTEIQFPVDFVA